MTTPPRVSVFMPVYNGANYLKASIQSVLSQELAEPFELVIINDGSTDDSVTIIQSFTDERIQLFHNERNRGLAFTENRCLECCRGEYLAKLDCDDIMLPGRLHEQATYLDQHQQVGLLGSNIEVINSAGEQTGRVWRYPAPAELVPAIMLFTNYFVHPAIMLRRSALPEVWYRGAYNPAEDYDLFSRLLAAGYGGYNLQKILTLYRIHDNNISKTQQSVQENSMRQTQKNQLSQLEIELDEAAFDVFFRFASERLVSSEDFTRMRRILFDIVKANAEKQLYDSTALVKVSNYYWMKNCLRRAKQGNLLLGGFQLFQRGVGPLRELSTRF